MNTRSNTASGLIDWFATVTLVIAALTGVVVIVSWLAARRAEEASARSRLAPADFVALLESGTRIGDPAAPAVLAVFNDYRCGFCAELAQTLELLTRRYPQHLAVVYMHYLDTSTPTGRDYRMPEGAECAKEQGKFEAYHAAVFANRRYVHYADGAWLVGVAVTLPDSSAFQRCLETRRYAEVVLRHFREARRLGVEVTPTSFLNGFRIEGAIRLESLDSLIVGELPR